MNRPNETLNVKMTTEEKMGLMRLLFIIVSSIGIGVSWIFPNLNQEYYLS